MATVKHFKCPFCNKSMTREDLVRHIEDMHSEDIPPGYTAMRVAFNWINYGKIYYEGKCTECGAPTEWDENKGRYNRQCGKKSCHDSFVKRFEANMNRKLGMTRLSTSPEGQEYMLANRKISGKYKFRDGTEKTYTGSYEKEALKFLDQVMECRSDDILTPGPIMEYEYNGEKHWYISDIYYVPYNLVIEVKDGGDKPNTRNMPEYRAKQIAKEKYIVDHTDYNYLRLTNNDFSQLLSTMADLKMQLVEHTDQRIVNINENMFASIGSMFPMQSSSNPQNVHVVNYMQNNVFSGEDPNEDIAVTDSPKFDSVFYRDADGKLKETDESFFENTTFQVYKTDTDWNTFRSKINDKIDDFVDEAYLYETATGSKYYSADQVRFNPNLEEIPDEYTIESGIQQAIKEYALGKSYTDVATDAKGNPALYINKDSHKVYLKESDDLDKQSRLVADVVLQYLNGRS